MVKKVKEEKTNLYNFNAEDEESKKIKQKNKKNTKNKPKKKTNNNKTNKNEKEQLFNFNNEIVIGLPKQEETKSNNEKKQNNKNKSSKKKPNKKKTNTKKQNTKNKKTISKKEEQIKKQKRIKRFKVIKYTFLALLLLTAIIATMTSPLFNIKQITVTGNNKITNDEIISLSQINIQENTYKTNMKKAKTKILENPYIKSVEIKRKLPSNVEIIVEERKTTFMIEYGNSYVYINNQGYILEVSSEKLEVPILQGAETITEDFIPGNRLCVEDLEKMSTVIKIMEIATSNEISSLITRIDIQSKQNYKIVFETEQKVAYIGDETDLNTKILNIKSILERESGIRGEIFVNMDLKTNDATFRQTV